MNTPDLLGILLLVEYWKLLSAKLCQAVHYSCLKNLLNIRNLLPIDKFVKAITVTFNLK